MDDKTNTTTAFPVPGSRVPSALSLADVVEIFLSNVFAPHDLDAFGQQAWGVPLLAWGGSGLAKTAILKALARRMQVVRARPLQEGASIGASSVAWHCEILSPAARGSGAFGCTPVPVDGPSGVLRIGYPLAQWVDTFPLAEDGRPYGMLFIDELSAVEPRLQAYLLASLAEREFNGSPLSGAIRMVAAANPAAIAANGYELTPALANRLAHLPWPTDVAAWHAHLRRRAGLAHGPLAVEETPIDVLAEQARVIEEIGPYLQLETELMVGFTAVDAKWAYDQPEPGDPRGGGPWPSPRSNTMLIDLLASARLRRLSAAQVSALIRACCGDDFALAYAKYREDKDLPDLDAILDGQPQQDGKPWTPSPQRIDVTSIVLRGCADKVILQAREAANKGADLRPIRDRAARLWTLLAAAPTDVTLTPVRALLGAALRPSSKEHPEAARLADELVKCGADLLTAVRAA